MAESSSRCAVSAAFGSVAVELGAAESLIATETAVAVSPGPTVSPMSVMKFAIQTPWAIIKTDIRAIAPPAVLALDASHEDGVSAAATSMASQATGLAQAVSQFRVDENGQGRAPLAGAHATAPVLGATPAPPRRRETAVVRRERALTADGDEWKEF